MSLNTNFGLERKTEIIDGLSLPQQQPVKKKGSNKANRQQKKNTFSLSQPQNAGIAKQKPAKSNGLTAKAKAAVPAKGEPRFYEEKGLKIPLLYPNSKKRKPYARLSNTLRLKLNDEALKDIVRQYAGEEQVQKFENSRKASICDWIEEVETRALGPNPKSELQKTYRLEEAAGVFRGKQVLGSANAVATPLVTAPAPAPAPRTNKNLTVVQSSKASIKRHTNPKSNTVQGRVTSLNALAQAKIGKRKHDEDPAPTLPQQTQKRAKKQHHHDISAKEQLSREILRQAPAPPPASPMKQSPLEKRVNSDSMEDGDSDKNSQQYGQDQLNSIANAPRVMQVASFPSSHRQPLLNALNMHPECLQNSTTVINLPECKTHIIVTKTSDTTIHQTEVPYGTPQSQLAPHLTSASNRQRSYLPISKPTPYLKPGKHGWDYDLHKWSWQGDADLHTGIGHQVEPADQKRLERDATFKKEFREKYPGRLVNQWPCGCQMPWNDSDSEEES